MLTGQKNFHGDLDNIKTVARCERIFSRSLTVSLWNSALQSHHPMLALDPCRQFPASDQYYQKLIVTVIVLP